MNASSDTCTSLSISRLVNRQTNVGLVLSYLLGLSRMDLYSTGGKMPLDERGDLISHRDSISFRIQRSHNERMVVPHISAFAEFIPAFSFGFCVYVPLVVSLFFNGSRMIGRQIMAKDTTTPFLFSNEHS